MHKILEETRDLLAAELAGKPPESISRHPGGDAACWNAWQVSQHLAESWRLTGIGLQHRLDRQAPLLTPRTARQRVIQFAVTRLGYLPKGRKAPPSVLPPPGPSQPISGDELVAALSQTLADMDRMMDAIEPTAKGSPVLTHFVLGPLSVDQWRRFHRRHARHHAPQIARAIAAPSYIDIYGRNKAAQ